MKRGCAFSLIAVLVIMLVMLVTCPKASDHKEVLQGTLQEVVNAKMDSSMDDGMFGSILKVAGKLAIGTTGDIAVDRMLRVDDYYLFSVGRVTFRGKEHIISVGMFNHVFAPDKEDVLKEMGKYGF